jgi:transposase-like protein
MNAKSKQIEKFLERGIPVRQIARVLDVSREWVMHVRYRYEARKYKKMYDELLAQTKEK